VIRLNLRALRASFESDRFIEKGRKMTKGREFFQDGPQLKNQYDDDVVLRHYLMRVLPPTMLRSVEPGLRLFGAHVADNILLLGKTAEASPPKHIPYDAWGKRIDRIETSEAWRDLGRIAAKTGLVSEAYGRQYGVYSRILQFARVYLFGASSALYTCPLAMTDGAARAIELYGDGALKQGAFKKLTSSDPADFWTSGQWMTEREGGSDVGRSATTAVPARGGYRLSGTKWFTSAIDAPMAMTLARIKGATEGNRGLSLFYLETHDKRGAWNHITVHRLKDKLGTKAVPTAEVTMERTRATLVGEAGKGVREITTILNITRVWNACEAVSLMRRSIALARDYALRREAFGGILAEKPAHLETLAALETEFRGAFALTFKVVELLGKEEAGVAAAQELVLLRLLTPIAKLFTAKQAVAVASEALECFGGAGYIEDTDLPRLLRDAQVLSTWEGTTNVLALDVLRVIGEVGALDCFSAYVTKRLEDIRPLGSCGLVLPIRDATESLVQHWGTLRNLSRESQEVNARAISFGIARIAIACELLIVARWATENGLGEQATIAARRWCRTPLFSPHFPSLSDARLLACASE